MQLLSDIMHLTLYSFFNMKSILASLILFISLHPASAQTLNQLSIIPSNPDSDDTIRVITDFSYNGNCAYGMTYNYTYVAGDTIIMMPTFCGYWDTTACNSIDTIEAGPFPAGNYYLRIEFHQGSVCPISGFDATLMVLDTILNITTASGISDMPLQSFRVYPNPAHEKLFIDGGAERPGTLIRIYNGSGQLLYETSIYKNRMEINLRKANITKGVYILQVENGDEVYSRKVIVE
jgi:hypothetical protein